MSVQPITVYRFRKETVVSQDFDWKKIVAITMIVLLIIAPMGVAFAAGAQHLQESSQKNLSHKNVSSLAACCRHPYWNTKVAPRSFFSDRMFLYRTFGLFLGLSESTGPQTVGERALSLGWEIQAMKEKMSQDRERLETLRMQHAAVCAQAAEASKTNEERVTWILRGIEGLKGLREAKDVLRLIPDTALYADIYVRKFQVSRSLWQSAAAIYSLMRSFVDHSIFDTTERSLLSNKDAEARCLRNAAYTEHLLCGVLLHSYDLLEQCDRTEIMNLFKRSLKIQKSLLGRDLSSEDKQKLIEEIDWNQNFLNLYILNFPEFEVQKKPKKL